MSSYTEVSKESLQAMLAFSSEIFDKFMIIDPEVRERVCNMLLTDTHFVDHAGEKYDFILNAFDIQNTDNEFGMSTKPTVNVGGGLTNIQRSIITNNNMDYHINYMDGSPQPHPLAYAQRVVDTHRCKSEVSHRGAATVIDIGGNYATHAAQGNFNIHSCTLLDGSEEMHRQTQRDVNLELMGETRVNRCINGVQFCDVAAQEAFSLHTIPRIDPDDMPQIFHRHGLQFVTGVHHYDALMHFSLQGYLPDVEMHWRVEGADVRFFFDNDSSLDYVHPLEYLLRYSKTMYMSDPALSFIVFYKVDRISNGNLYWSMQRLEKATLGLQVLPPQYQYTSDDEVLSIQVPVYNENSAFPISDPRSYITKTKVVPIELFTYVYQYGMANDTANPEKPLSFSDIRNATQTFNFTRKLNGTSITVNQRLSSEDAEHVAMGIYLVIVQKEAQLRVVGTEYSKMFLRIQKKWGDENFVYLASKCFSMFAITPYLMMAKSFEACADLLAVHMRSVVRNSKVIASVTSELPYFLVSPVRLLNSTRTQDFSVGEVELDQPQRPEIVVENLRNFYENFQDQLNEQAKSKLLQMMTASESGNVDLNTTETKPELGKDKNFPKIVETRESLMSAIDFVHSKVDLQEFGQTEASLDEVHELALYRIYEAGLYNLDIGLNVQAEASSRCSETWTGTGPNVKLYSSRNNTTDDGAKYTRLVNGRLTSITDCTEYSIALDPVTKEFIDIRKDPEYEYSTHSEYLFFMNDFKIFNNLKLSRKLLAFAEHSSNAKMFEKILVDGIPGCGKTYEITNSYKASDSIYCAVRGTADDIRGRIAKKNIPAVDPKKRVKTTDSAVLNGTMISTTLFVDEGLMLQPGVIDYLGQATRATVVRVFGDSAQIGMIDRSSTQGMLRFPKTTLWSSIEYRNESYRIPADICVLIKRFYDVARRPLLKTYSPIRRSVTCRCVSEPTAPDYTVPKPGTLTMSFLVADKERTLAKDGFYDIKKYDWDEIPATATLASTVHEAQGKDVKHSKVIRMSTFMNPGFEMRPHQLVAFTRHKLSLEVVSVLDSDPYMDLAKIAMNITEQELDEVMLPTPEDLKKNFQ